MGQVVGDSNTTGNTYHAVLFSGGSMLDLGTLNGMVGNSYAFGINHDANIVGHSDTSTPGLYNAVMWRNDGSGNYTIANLDTGAGWGSSNAMCMNDYHIGILSAAQVAGYAYTNPGNLSHAVIWQGGREGFIMSDLDPLLPSGFRSLARGINKWGQVVGWRTNAGSGDEQAYLWYNGKASDLNTLIDKSTPGWTLMEATAINAKGQIVGAGFLAGSISFHAFLATPSALPPIIAVPSIYP